MQPGLSSQVYPVLDARCVQQLLGEAAATLHHHWLEVLRGITAKLPTAQGALTEKQVCAWGGGMLAEASHGGLYLKCVRGVLCGGGGGGRYLSM